MHRKLAIVREPLFADVVSVTQKKSFRLGSLFTCTWNIDRWRWQTQLWAAWADFSLQKNRISADFFTFSAMHVVQQNFLLWFIDFKTYLYHQNYKMNNSFIYSTCCRQTYGWHFHEFSHFLRCLNAFFTSMKYRNINWHKKLTKNGSE